MLQYHLSYGAVILFHSIQLGRKRLSVNWDEGRNGNSTPLISICVASLYSHSQQAGVDLRNPLNVKGMRPIKETRPWEMAALTSLCAMLQILSGTLGCFFGMRMHSERQQGRITRHWSSRALDSFFFFLDTKHRSNTGYRKKQGSQCNIYPNHTKPAFHPLSGHSTKSLIVFDKTH